MYWIINNYTGEPAFDAAAFDTPDNAQRWLKGSEKHYSVLEMPSKYANVSILYRCEMLKQLKSFEEFKSKTTFQ
jgi:hypothetical protein